MEKAIAADLSLSAHPELISRKRALKAAMKVRTAAPGISRVWALSDGVEDRHRVLPVRRLCQAPVTPRTGSETDSHPVFERSPRKVMTRQNGNAAAAVYVQTNDATNNEVLAFERRA